MRACVNSTFLSTLGAAKTEFPTGREEFALLAEGLVGRSTVAGMVRHRENAEACQLCPSTFHILSAPPLILHVFFFVGRPALFCAVLPTSRRYNFSPEICKNQPYGFASDVWALGVVLYELLALELPFQGRDIVQLGNRVLQDDPAPLSPSYSRRMRHMSTRLLAKDHEKRPTARDVVQSRLARRAMKSLAASYGQQAYNSAMDYATRPDAKTADEDDADAPAPAGATGEAGGGGGAAGGTPAEAGSSEPGKSPGDETALATAQSETPKTSDETDDAKLRNDGSTIAAGESMLVAAATETAAASVRCCDAGFVIMHRGVSPPLPPPSLTHRLHICVASPATLVLCALLCGDCDV